jgi:hypothetical protein
VLILQSVNLAIRFLLEVFALWAVGYWGFKVGEGAVGKWLLGLGAPILIAIAWATLGSPKSLIKLSTSAHFFVELLLFSLPAFALYAAGKGTLATLYAVVVILNRILMHIWDQ